MKTGNKIKHFRLIKGFSQEKMAGLLGISTKAYGNIERNITDLNLSRLQQIAKVLEVNVPKLLDFDEKNVINGDNNSATLNNYTDQSLAQENVFLKDKIQSQQTEIENLKQINALLKVTKE